MFPLYVSCVFIAKTKPLGYIFSVSNASQKKLQLLFNKITTQQPKHSGQFRIIAHRIAQNRECFSLVQTLLQSHFVALQNRLVVVFSYYRYANSKKMCLFLLSNLQHLKQRICELYVKRINQLCTSFKILRSHKNNNLQSSSSLSTRSLN